jgi:hypothetical protein
MFKNSFVSNNSGSVSKPIRPMARMFSSTEGGEDKQSIQEFADAAVSQAETDLDDLQVDFERVDGSELHADQL